MFPVPSELLFLLRKRSCVPTQRLTWVCPSTVVTTEHIKAFKCAADLFHRHTNLELLQTDIDAPRPILEQLGVNPLSVHHLAAFLAALGSTSNGCSALTDDELASCLQSIDVTCSYSLALYSHKCHVRLPVLTRIWQALAKEETDRPSAAELLRNVQAIRLCDATHVQPSAGMRCRTHAHAGCPRKLRDQVVHTSTNHPRPQDMGSRTN
jgi:hypothetical protein